MEQHRVTEELCLRDPEWFSAEGSYQGAFLGSSLDSSLLHKLVLSQMKVPASVIREKVYTKGNLLLMPWSELS